MLVTLEGICALRRLRMDLQENGGDIFPSIMHTEMFMLYDVCKYLDLNIFQCKEILGEAGWRYINAYLNSPITVSPQLDG